MHTVALPTKRPFSWKTYLVLMAIIVPVAFFAIPFAMTIQGDALDAMLEGVELPVPAWMLFAVDSVISIALCALLGGVGLFLAGRIGLGLPFIEGGMKKEPIWHKFPGVVALGIITGVVFVLAIVGLDLWAFGPPMEALLESEGVTISENIRPPAWQGFLVSFQAGVVEETLFRLFGLTLLAWLGGLIFRDEEGRPRLAVLWVANILFAVVFGLAHLPLTATVGLPLTPMVIIRAIVLNGLGGMMFAWLYWSRGLESAMVAHISADIVLHAIIPMIARAPSTTLRIAIGVGSFVVVAAIVAGLLVWKPAGRDVPADEAQPET